MSPRRVQRDNRDRQTTVVNRGMSHYCISVQWRSTFRTGDVQMLPYGGHGIMVRHRGSASESDAIRAKSAPARLIAWAPQARLPCPRCFTNGASHLNVRNLTM